MSLNTIKCDCGASVDLDDTDWCNACDKSIFAKPKHNNMEHDIVSYKQAIALDEIGYDTIHWFGNAASLYDIMGYHAMYVNYGIMLSGVSDGYISAPLKSQVLRWFREKYDAHMHPTLIMPNAYMVRYGLWTSKVFSTYEQAENACIDKLIELTKQQDNG